MSDPALTIPWVCRRCEHVQLVGISEDSLAGMQPHVICEQCKYDTRREEEYAHYHIDGVMALRTWRTLWKRKVYTTNVCMRMSLAEEVVKHVDDTIAKHPKASLCAYGLFIPSWTYTRHGEKADAKINVTVQEIAE